MPTRFATWPIVILCLALATGCGAPEPLTKEQAARAVLTRENAGPTFVRGEAAPLTTRLGCVEEMSNFSGKAATKPAAKAISQFGNDSLSGLPAMRVEVRSYQTKDQAAAVLTAIKNAAKQCTSVKIEGQSSKFTMTVQHDEETNLKDSDAQLNTIGLGEATNDNGMKVPTGLWLTNALKDNNLLTVTYLNFSTTDEAVAQAYTKAAWQRMLDVAAGNKPAAGRVKLPKQALEQEGQSK